MVSFLRRTLLHGVSKLSLVGEFCENGRDVLKHVRVVKDYMDVFVVHASIGFLCRYFKQNAKINNFKTPSIVLRLLL